MATQMVALKTTEQRTRSRPRRSELVTALNGEIFGGMI